MGAGLVLYGGGRLRKSAMVGDDRGEWFEECVARKVGDDVDTYF